MFGSVIALGAGVGLGAELRYFEKVLSRWVGSLVADGVERGHGLLEMFTCYCDRIDAGLLAVVRDLPEFMLERDEGLVDRTQLFRQVVRENSRCRYDLVAEFALSNAGGTRERFAAGSA